MGVAPESDQVGPGCRCLMQAAWRLTSTGWQSHLWLAGMTRRHRSLSLTRTTKADSIHPQPSPSPLSPARSPHLPDTVPVTRTLYATATVGADEVKTKMPEDVLSRASGLITSCG